MLSMWSLLLVSTVVTVASAASVYRQHEAKRSLADLILSAPRTKCMEDLGCFAIDDDFFHPMYRPLNLLPADRENINTKFLLFTRNNRNTANTLRAKNQKLLDSSKFSANRKTKLIVHGYLDSEWLADWMHGMKDELLAKADVNVIIVDWSGGSKLPYTQATSNTRVVGAEIAFLLNWLKDTKGLKLEDCHILGHSLGSHVAGYAGAALKNLGRITGMDPAEPYFQNMPISVRIDPSDAKFVDIVHTDVKSILVLGLGMNQLCGHVDFFPNGGFSQPGCDLSRFKTFITEGIVGGMRNSVACNHHRALDFVKASIMAPAGCHQTGYVCDSWDAFRGGHCTDCGKNGENCALLGDLAPDHYDKFKNNPQKAFYLKTAGKAPFCVFQYHVAVKVHKDSRKGNSAAIVLKVKGTPTTEEEFKLNDGEYLDWEPDKTFTFVVGSSKDLGDLKQVTLNWQPGLLGLLRKVKLESITIKPMNGLDEKAKTSKSRKYCAAKLGDLGRATDHILNSRHLC